MNVSELQGLAATTFAPQVVVTNDSPRANIVIAKYGIKPPWNDAEIEPLDDVEESSPDEQALRDCGLAGPPPFLDLHW